MTCDLCHHNREFRLVTFEKLKGQCKYILFQSTMQENKIIFML